MGLRNAVLFVGGLTMLVVTSPRLMLIVLAVIGLVVLPAVFFGTPRAQAVAREPGSHCRFERDRRRDTECDPSGAELHSASFESRRFGAANEHAFDTSIRRTRARSLLTAFVIIGVFASLLYGVYSGAQSVIAGRISLGELSESVLYVMLVASSVAVLAEVWGEVVRAAGATERLVELLATRSDIADPAQPRSLPGASGGVSVEFDHVTFRYPSRPSYAVLDDLSLAIEAAKRWPWSVRPVPARQPFFSFCCASTTSPKVRSGLTVSH